MAFATLRRLRALMMRTMPYMMTCRELDGFIVDYLEKTLPERQRKIFELHLRMCRDCRSYLDSYKSVISLGRAVFDEADEPVPHEVPEELVKAILSARKKDV